MNNRALILRQFGSRLYTYNMYRERQRGRKTERGREIKGAEREKGIERAV